MTTLAVGVPDKAKVAFTMHSTRLVLNIGGRQVSINPYGGSKGAKTSKTRHAWRVKAWRSRFPARFSPMKSKVQFYCRHPLYVHNNDNLAQCESEIVVQASMLQLAVNCDPDCDYQNRTEEQNQLDEDAATLVLGRLSTQHRQV